MASLIYFYSLIKFNFILIHALSGRSAVWLARTVRDRKVGGSNPLAPTLISFMIPREQK